MEPEQAFIEATVKMHAAAVKGGFDPDICVDSMNLISGGFGVGMIRGVIENFMHQGANEVAKVMTEYLLQDSRVSYQKLGQTMMNKFDI